VRAGILESDVVAHVLVHRHEEDHYLLVEPYHGGLLHAHRMKLFIASSTHVTWCKVLCPNERIEQAGWTHLMTQRAFGKNELSRIGPIKRVDAVGTHNSFLCSRHLFASAHSHRMRGVG